jgi:hypothetical protein
MDESPKATWSKFEDALAAVKAGHLTKDDVASDSDSDNSSIGNGISGTSKQGEKDVFEKLAEYPTYNVEDRQLDAAIMAVQKRIAAADAVLAKIGLGNGDPGVDLCPFCDDPLPTSPTDTLFALREALEDETWPAPTSLNPNHRDAKNWRVTHEFCVLHEFEVKSLPKVQHEGWPHWIDFASLHTRVFKLRSQLQDILAKPQGNTYFQTTKALWESFRSNACGIRNEFAVFQGGSAG